MRNIVEVAQKIKAAVPVEQPNRADLDNTVTHIARTAVYTAPEVMGDLWDMLAKSVNDLVGPAPLADQWRVEVVAHFTDKSVTEAQKLWGVHA